MLESIIDIHSHTLWDVDDGAENFREAFDLCFIAEDTGTKTLFVTPHLMYWERAEQLFDTRERKLEELNEKLEEVGSSLILKKGFEIFCDDDIFNVKYFKPYTLAGSRYILIEFDFFKAIEADVAAWCKYLLSFGLVPIIAHPERYGFVHNDISCIERLSSLGALFQINAGSPAGMFGAAEEGVSCSMINNGYMDFIGSDAHDPYARNTDISGCIENYPEFVDLNAVKRAALDNPLYILEDKKFSPERYGTLIY